MLRAQTQKYRQTKRDVSISVSNISRPISARRPYILIAAPHLFIEYLKYSSRHTPAHNPLHTLKKGVDRSLYYYSCISNYVYCLKSFSIHLCRYIEMILNAIVKGSFFSRFPKVCFAHKPKW